jgi:hypothetical protein
MLNVLNTLTVKLVMVEHGLTVKFFGNNVASHVLHKTFNTTAHFRVHQPTITPPDPLRFL